MREAKGKGEVSDLERTWGKPPHLFVLSELVPMVPVVISRCWVTVFFFFFKFNYGGREGVRRGRTGPPGAGFGTEQPGRGWSQASPPRAGPAHDSSTPPPPPHRP